eukprot:TRINITY_DN109572_c0_g1_i1.p1 TRINITY_DN109572_c0_g1~~TRINITY_DN109572_c0_g1_i1.p1  ORF type:complete len:288 (-),score=36.73 TRINITY_DN109572_c0_g1_i1:789-1652(-)
MCAFAALETSSSDENDSDHEQLVVKQPQFPPGCIIKAIRTAIMREGQHLQSMVVKEIPAKSMAHVICVDGRRLFVRGACGSQGWVSTAAKDGTSLWQLVETAPLIPAPHDSCEADEVVSVRKFHDADRPELKSLERRCFAREEQCVDRWLQMSYDAEEHTFVYVAEDRKTSAIVGYCAWAFEGDPDRSRGDSSLIHIISLAVDPDRRGQRIGEKLMNFVADTGQVKFPLASCEMLHVRTENYPAHRLYERLGFTCVRPVLQYYSDGDAWEMRRVLKKPLSWLRLDDS